MPARVTKARVHPGSCTGARISLRYEFSTVTQILDFVLDSPNPSRAYIRLCKHGKRFLLLK